MSLVSGVSFYMFSSIEEQKIPLKHCICSFFNYSYLPYQSLFTKVPIQSSNFEHLLSRHNFLDCKRVNQLFYSYVPRDSQLVFEVGVSYKSSISMIGNQYFLLYILILLRLMRLHHEVIRLAA